MRINHNLTAINTHRQMGISELDGSKSMEKLSSGFRINRAGDDAAGLAISEKMRGQVRGLSMASKNSSDTISLIQTAEGALAETHSILQRMRELSVQSANDTNTDKDREELQAEVTQLKAEIDRIGNTTEFNTKKLLEGSATGVRDEIVGTLRINNNSSVVIDANKEKSMSASITEDKSWKFDGAYMLVKVNQTYDANSNRVFKAEDYNLVGPDGEVYKFKTYTPDTKILANGLEEGTIVAEGGDILNVVAAGAIATAGTVTIGAELTHKELATVAVGSVLVTGSNFTLKDNTAFNVINTATPNNPGISSMKSVNGVLILSPTSGADVRVEAGETVTLDNGTVLKNHGGGLVSIESGSITTNTLLDAANAVATAFTVAAQSTLTAASTTLLPDTDIVKASNLLVKNGSISSNVTVGNTVNLTCNKAQAADPATGDINSLAAGSVLAKGSTIQMLQTANSVNSIKIEVKGKEVDISYDTTNKILKVGGETVAAGKSITLEDGTVLTHNSTVGDPNTANGVVFVEQGSITLAQEITAMAGNVPNVGNFIVAKDSTLAAGTKLGGTASYATAGANATTAADGAVRLMAGTVVTSSVTTFSGSVTIGAGGKNMQFSANVGDGLAARYYELNVTDSFTFIFTEYDPASSNLNDSIMSQIGANSGQTTFLSINDMRCKALGVSEVDISTKWGAATAIETVNNALQKVSHQRSSLGALQNRLEHTIKNLDTAAENLQAAESRIRDVDMAKEVMEFTRTNILQQAAQAMLAQANQQPQSVLQLLR
ncbi:flagellin [Fibrobacteres bacterium R8-0-B4]